MTAQVPPGPRIRQIRDARRSARCGDSRSISAPDLRAGSDPSSRSPTHLRREGQPPIDPVLEATPQHGCRPLLRRNGGGEPLASLGTPALDDRASCLGLHARPETVLPKPLDATRLISSLHLFLSPPSVPCRLPAGPNPRSDRRCVAGFCAASARERSGSPKRSNGISKRRDCERTGPCVGDRFFRRSKMSNRVG